MRGSKQIAEHAGHRRALHDYSAVSNVCVFIIVRDAFIYLFYFILYSMTITLKQQTPFIGADPHIYEM